MFVRGYEKKEKSTAELTMELTPEEFNEAVNKVYVKARSRISIPGFRKGKAPRKIVEKFYGSDVFYDDAIEAVAPDALKQGVEEKKLTTVGRPTLSNYNVNEDGGLTMIFDVSLYPEVTLGQYKGLRAPKGSVEVTDADVTREIEAVREQNARIETAERESISGDIVNIDYEGFVDGVAFEGGKDENYDLEIGSNRFIPGFEEQLIGKKAGDSFDVNVTFPENYSNDLAGKEAVFKVKVNEVSVKLLPDRDDEFAKDVSEFDTLDEYIDDLRKKLQEQREQAVQSEFENAIIDRLIDGVQCEVPDAMIDDQLDNMMGNFRYNLSAQGMTMEQYMGFTGMTESDIRKHNRPMAEKQIKADLAFEAIAQQENFEITDEALENEYKRMAEAYRMDVDEIKKNFTDDAVITGLKINAAHELVFSTAEPETAEDSANELSETAQASETPEASEASGPVEAAEAKTDEVEAPDTVSESQGEN